MSELVECTVVGKRFSNVVSGERVIVYPGESVSVTPNTLAKSPNLMASGEYKARAVAAAEADKSHQFAVQDVQGEKEIVAAAEEADDGEDSDDE